MSSLPLPCAGLAALLFAGCAPPPLPTDGASDSPSIRFIFPENGLDQAVCPDFLVAVAIDNWDLAPPDPDSAPVDGRGHWHLDDDITGDYIATDVPYADHSADLDGDSSRSYRLTASLVNVNHTPLDLTDAPSSVDTVEFEVADDPDCLGGGGAAAGQ